MLTNNYFTLFALPEQYVLNVEKLKESYLKLQQQIHPDRFVEASAHAKRLAVEYAARINQAYRTLCDPIQRAQYLLKQKGFELSEETTTLTSDFLMEQMELREKLADIASQHAHGLLEEMKHEIDEKRKQLNEEMAALFQSNNIQVSEAKICVYKMQFYAKLEEEIATVESTWHC